MVQEDEPHTVVIDLDAATTMDMDGVEILIKIIGELDRQGINVLLSRVESEHVELFRKLGVLDEIGSENIFDSVRAAVAAAQQAEKISPAESTQSPGSSNSQENSA